MGRLKLPLKNCYQVVRNNLERFEVWIKCKNARHQLASGISAETIWNKKIFQAPQTATAWQSPTDAQADGNSITGKASSRFSR